jgi:hypothetical protein
VEFDAQLWAEIQRSAMLFLEAIDTKTPPQLEALDAQAYAIATPQESDEFVEADSSLENVYRQLREVNAELHFLEEKKGSLEIILKEAIGNKAGLAGAGWTVYWKQARPSQVTDWKMVAQAAGALPSVITTYTDVKPGRRRFIINDGGLHD